MAGRSTLRVLETYQPVSQELEQEWERVIALLSKTDLVNETLTQDLHPDYADAPFESLSRLDLNPLSREIAGESIAMAFNDLTSCRTGVSPPQGDFGYEGEFIVRTWIIGNETFGSNSQVAEHLQEHLDRLNALSLGDAQQWIAEHEENLRTCTWNAADFS